MRPNRQRLMISAVAVVAACSGAASCNTFKGIGQDMQAGGAAIEDAAEDVRSGMRRPDEDPDGPRTSSADQELAGGPE